MNDVSLSFGAFCKNMDETREENNFELEEMLERVKKEQKYCETDENGYFCLNKGFLPKLDLISDIGLVDEVQYVFVGNHKIRVESVLSNLKEAFSWSEKANMKAKLASILVKPENIRDVEMKFALKEGEIVDIEFNLLTETKLSYEKALEAFMSSVESDEDKLLIPTTRKSLVGANFSSIVCAVDDNLMQLLRSCRLKDVEIAFFSKLMSVLCNLLEVDKDKKSRQLIANVSKLIKVDEKLLLSLILGESEFCQSEEEISSRIQTVCSFIYRRIVQFVFKCTRIPVNAQHFSIVIANSLSEKIIDSSQLALIERISGLKPQNKRKIAEESKIISFGNKNYALKVQKHTNLGKLKSSNKILNGILHPTGDISALFKENFVLVKFCSIDFELVNSTLLKKELRFFSGFSNFYSFPLEKDSFKQEKASLLISNGFRKLKSKVLLRQKRLENRVKMVFWYFKSKFIVCKFNEFLPKLVKIQRKVREMLKKRSTLNSIKKRGFVLNREFIKH